MKRYFYDSPLQLQKWLQKNSFAKLFQDSTYRSAFLAGLRNNPSEQYKILRQKILNMTIPEQQKYNQNSSLECLYNLFYSLHRASKGRPTILNSALSSTTQLVDPDKFPIWDLKNHAPVYSSAWSHYLSAIRYDMGFQMIVRESQIDHVAGGNGVYIVLAGNRKKIQPGTFLGLVPGKMFETYQDFKIYREKYRSSYHRELQHIHFPTGKILELGDLSINKSDPFGLETQYNKSTSRSDLVDATYHNPFATGHMINHPPPLYEANVCFSEIVIPSKYLPSYLLQYLPYEYYFKASSELTLYGIFAMTQLEDRQQLFVNYNESHIYPINDVPEWMVQPPMQSNILGYLKKGEYELAEKSYWKLVEKKVMEKNRALYEEYEKRGVREPGEVEFEDGQAVVRKMKIKEPRDEI